MFLSPLSQGFYRSKDWSDIVLCLPVPKITVVEEEGDTENLTFFKEGTITNRFEGYFLPPKGGRIVRSNINKPTEKYSKAAHMMAATAVEWQWVILRPTGGEGYTPGRPPLAPGTTGAFRADLPWTRIVDPIEAVTRWDQISKWCRTQCVHKALTAYAEEHKATPTLTAQERSYGERMFRVPGEGSMRASKFVAECKGSECTVGQRCVIRHAIVGSKMPVMHHATTLLERLADEQNMIAAANALIIPLETKAKTNAPAGVQGGVPLPPPQIVPSAIEITKAPNGKLSCKFAGAVAYINAAPTRLSVAHISGLDQAIRDRRGAGAGASEGAEDAKQGEAEPSTSALIIPTVFADQVVSELAAHFLPTLAHHDLVVHNGQGAASAAGASASSSTLNVHGESLALPPVQSRLVSLVGTANASKRERYAPLMTAEALAAIGVGLFKATVPRSVVMQDDGDVTLVEDDTDEEVVAPKRLAAPKKESTGSGKLRRMMAADNSPAAKADFGLPKTGKRKHGDDDDEDYDGPARAATARPRSRGVIDDDDDTLDEDEIIAPTHRSAASASSSAAGGCRAPAPAPAKAIASKPAGKPSGQPLFAWVNANASTARRAATQLPANDDVIELMDSSDDERPAAKAAAAAASRAVAGGDDEECADL